MTRRTTLALGLALLVLTLAPFAVEGTYYRFLAIIVFIYSIVAIGLNVLAGYAGQFSLGHAALMAVGAYTSAILSKHLGQVPQFATWGGHVLLGIAVGAIAAAAFGGLLAIPALRVRGPYLAMVTIAFGWVIFKILQEWVSVTGGDLGISGIPKLQFGSHLIGTEEYYYVALAAFVAALILQQQLVRSRFGLRIKAMRNSELGIASVGINVYRLKVVTFVVSASFAGVGGALFAHQQNYISPDNFQFFSSVFFLLAVLFGGAGTAAGPVIGAAVLTVLPEMLHDFERYRLIIYGTFILVTLYFLPRGVAGAFEQRRSLQNATAERSAPGGSSAVDLGTRGAALEARDVSRSFGGIRAVQGVSLSVSSGEVHALIGPNGAGKTTFINLVSGFYPLETGVLLVNGAEIRPSSMSDASRLGISRTFQTIKLFSDLTVLENVLVALPTTATAIWSSHAGAERNRANDLLRFVGLAGMEARRAGQLAYGHRRLLEIARALATEPKLLLLDEPAAGLVVEEVDQLARLIRRLKQSGLTVLLVEHHMDLVTSVSDRVTVLDHGTIIARGTPGEIQKTPAVIEAYLGVGYAAA